MHAADDVVGRRGQGAHLTPLHFQPRPDLVPDPERLKAAKAPLLRKLVQAALTESLDLRHEKLPAMVQPRAREQAMRYLPRRPLRNAPATI